MRKEVVYLQTTDGRMVITDAIDPKDMKGGTSYIIENGHNADWAVIYDSKGQPVIDISIEQSDLTFPVSEN